MCCVKHMLVPNGKPTMFCKHPFLVCVSLPFGSLCSGPRNSPLEGWEVRNLTLSRSKEECCCCVAEPQTRHKDRDLESDLNTCIVTTSRNLNLENGIQR